MKLRYSNNTCDMLDEIGLGEEFFKAEKRRLIAQSLASSKGVVSFEELIVITKLVNMPNVIISPTVELQIYVDESYLRLPYKLCNRTFPSISSIADHIERNKDKVFFIGTIYKQRDDYGFALVTMESLTTKPTWECVKLKLD